MVRRIEIPKRVKREQVEESLFKNMSKSNKKKDAIFGIKCLKFVILILNALVIISKKNDFDGYITTLFVTLFSTYISLIEKFCDENLESTIVTKIGIISTIIPVSVLTIGRKINITYMENIKYFYRDSIAILLVIFFYIFIFVDFGFKKIEREV